MTTYMQEKIDVDSFRVIVTKFQRDKTRQINKKGVIMTTYMQEEIDVDAIPRKTDVPVCTTITTSLYRSNSTILLTADQYNQFISRMQLK